MEDKDLFAMVLDKDETITKTYRPNRGRAWFAVILIAVIFAIILLPISISGFISPEDGGVETAISMLLIFVVYLLASTICTALWCSKTVYAVTNKRVIIRTGYIGVDYKSLDFKMVGAFTVNVSWVDKVLRKNTGTLAFGSTASPMVGNNVAKFNFSFIHNPYEVYREIKEMIDAVKENNAN